MPIWKAHLEDLPRSQWGRLRYLSIIAEIEDSPRQRRGRCRRRSWENVRPGVEAGPWSWRSMSCELGLWVVFHDGCRGEMLLVNSISRTGYGVPEAVGDR